MAKIPISSPVCQCGCGAKTPLLPSGRSARYIPEHDPLNRRKKQLLLGTSSSEGRSSPSTPPHLVQRAKWAREANSFSSNAFTAAVNPSPVQSCEYQSLLERFAELSVQHQQILDVLDSVILSLTSLVHRIEVEPCTAECHNELSSLICQLGVLGNAPGRRKRPVEAPRASRPAQLER